VPALNTSFIAIIPREIAPTAIKVFYEEEEVYANF